MAYIRKTRDEVQLWANYGNEWEHELSENTYREGRERLKEYRENAGQYRYKLKIARVKINNEDNEKRNI